MDVEKTMHFILDQQAKFEANLAAFQAKFDADMKELRDSQRATERLINAFAKAGEAQIELHTARLDGSCVAEVTTATVRDASSVAPGFSPASRAKARRYNDGF